MMMMIMSRRDGEFGALELHTISLFIVYVLSASNSSKWCPMLGKPTTLNRKQGVEKQYSTTTISAGYRPGLRLRTLYRLA